MKRIYDHLLNSTGFNVRRKFFHISLGLILVSLIQIPNVRKIMPYVLMPILVFGLLLSILAIFVKVPIIYHLLKLFEKKEHIESFPGKGAFYFIAAALFSLMLFDHKVASASLLILTLGDPAAFIFGKYYGRTRLALSKTKLLEGTIGGIIVGMLSALFFLPPIEAFIAALAGMFVESIELEFWHLDDNFSIPLAAGGAVMLLRFLI